MIITRGLIEGILYRISWGFNPDHIAANPGLLVVKGQKKNMSLTKASILRCQDKTYMNGGSHGRLLTRRSMALTIPFPSGRRPLVLREMSKASVAMTVGS